jgi:DNA topoisomerase-2
VQTHFKFAAFLDEILVNAADNYQRDKSMDRIEVTIDQVNGEIAVWNNGRGIPIEIHKEHNCYVPELIFGHLLTSSNYDDSQEKVTGGRNGFGAKLANIFSTQFTIETGDRAGNKHYRQVFRKNMSAKDEPVIGANLKGKDFTCITFKPDLAKFSMTHLEADTVALMTKRVYDLAGVTPRGVRVVLNGKPVPVKDFRAYADCYLKSEEAKELPAIAEAPSDRWEVVFSLSEGAFT